MLTERENKNQIQKCDKMVDSKQLEANLSYFMNLA